MFKIIKRIAIFVGLLILGLLGCVGCVYSAPQLSATQTASPEPLPESTPRVYVPKGTQEAGAHKLDALQMPIDDEEHYNRYISFSDIYIYEYNDGTFMDAKCKNSYVEALKGSAWIEFTDENGSVVARAPIVAAEGVLSVQPGETRVFANIDTDTDVQKKDFTIVYETAFLPVSLFE